MPLGPQPAKYEQFQPPDLAGLRGQQLGLLQALLGLNGAGFGNAGQAQPSSPLGGTGRRIGMTGQQPGAQQQTGAGLPNFGEFFGGLGSPTTGLQRQAGTGIEQFLNQPAPEQRALDVSMPALQGILSGAPGAGIMDALKPRFDQNLASANQQGGRFGSGNAILRSRAVDDYNMLGAQAAQQGQQSQIQAAQMLGLLSNQAGQNPFNRLQGAYGIGQAGAQQADLETQRRLQILMTLLGSAQGLAFNQPITQTQQASGGILPGLLGMAAGSFFGPLGAAAGSAAAGSIFGGQKQG